MNKFERANKRHTPEVQKNASRSRAASLVFEVGRMASLADGAVIVRYGDSVVLSTAEGEAEAREGMDFFPLTVDYEERMFAAGKIPGGFIKREGRPSEHAILSARLTDRPLRPLFPSGYRNEVQVMSTVFSTDQQNDPDILSINGASTALTISSVPFEGPSVACAWAGSMASRWSTQLTTNSKIARWRSSSPAPPTRS